MVRNYVGGLEALVQLLMSDNIYVQAAVCEAVAAIAMNTENLAIMSDHGVVQYLARLTQTVYPSSLLYFLYTTLNRYFIKIFTTMIQNSIGPPGCSCVSIGKLVYFCNSNTQSEVRVSGYPSASHLLYYILQFPFTS